MPSSSDQLLAEMKAFVAETKTAPTTLGMKAIGDPNLMSDMENNKRSPSLRVADKVRDYMERERTRIVRNEAKALRKAKAKAS